MVEEDATVKEYAVPRGFVRLHTGGSSRRPHKGLLAECGAPNSGILAGEATAPISIESARSMLDLLRDRGFSPVAFLEGERRVRVLAEGAEAGARYLREVGWVPRWGRR